MKVTMSEYETILKEIRPFGPFQARTFILVSLFETPLAWAMLVPVFTAASPGFRCSFPASSSDNSSNGLLGDLNTCRVNGTECISSNISFNLAFTSIVSEWFLVCDKKYVGELITSLQMAGVLFGALIAGQIADYFGRKRVLFGGYTLLILFWFNTAFVPNWQVYAALRFIVGALIGGCLVVNFVLPLEFVTPSWRTFCGCIGFWAVGIMTLAPWAYFFREWRMLNIVMSLASMPLLALWCGGLVSLGMSSVINTVLITLDIPNATNPPLTDWLVYPFIDESPRWLLSRGYIKEAKEIIIKMAAFNNRPTPDLYPLQQFVEREQIERKENEKYSYWHLCSSYDLAKSTAICMYGWFVASGAYYGHNFNSKNLAGNRYLNVFISGFVEIPALIFVLLANNRIGRRPTTFILFMISGLACFAVLIIDMTGKSDELSTLTVTMAMLGKSCIAGGWAAVQIFSAEIFPTVIRNIGIASCSMAARIGGIVAPQLVLLGQSSKAVPFTVFGIVSILCSLLILLLKETVKTSLPDRLPTVHTQTSTTPLSHGPRDFHSENNASVTLLAEVNTLRNPDEKRELKEKGDLI